MMVGKLLLIIGVLQIASVSASHGIILPTFGGAGRGGVYMSWLGFKASFTLGKHLGANSTDGGLLIQLRLPPGKKTAILLDGNLSLTGIGGVLMMGSQFPISFGYMTGIGFNIGIRGIQCGICVATRKFRNIKHFQLGRYGGRLCSLSDEVLSSIEINRSTDIVIAASPNQMINISHVMH